MGCRPCAWNSAVKASAGAVEYVKVARVSNLARTIEQLKKTSEEPKKAEIKPNKENANNSSDKKETPQNQPQNKPDEEKRNHKGILFAIAAAIFTIVLFIGGSALLNKNKNDIPEEPVEEVIEDNTPEPMPAELKNEWLGNKAINPDFIGSIKFDSGLIDLPFVQATDVYDRYGKPYSRILRTIPAMTSISGLTGKPASMTVTTRAVLSLWTTATISRIRT